MTGRNIPKTLEPVPNSYWTPAEQQGSLTELRYETWESRTYQQHKQRITKRAVVYLPYGYSSEIRYNTYYLMHGGGGTEERQLGSPDAPNTMKNAIDHMIEDGRIAPLIIICPTYNNLSARDSWDYHLAYDILTPNFHNELLNDLLPAVDKTYSTYAARDHRCFAGFSMGSVCTLHNLMHCLGAFRYFQPMSGCVDPRAIDATVAASGFAPEDFFLYGITGSRDFAGEGFAELMRRLARMPSGHFIMADNEADGNLALRVKPGGAHDEDALREYVYNGLLWLWNHEGLEVTP